MTGVQGGCHRYYSVVETRYFDMLGDGVTVSARLADPDDLDTALKLAVGLTHSFPQISDR